MISELRTFLVVAELGSFSAAGRQVGLTQAAIGAQIKRLEQELGYQVFDRSGWAVSLTVDGQAILGTVEEIVAAYERLHDRKHQTPGHRVLRIGTISTTHATLMAPATARLCAAFPALAVHLVPGTSMQLLERLDARDLDAAVMVRPPFGLMPQMRWHGIQMQDYVLVTCLGVPGADWREVMTDQPFVRYDSRSFGGRGVDRFLRAQGVAPRTVVETEDIQTILQMVANGIGCAIVPLVQAIGLTQNIRVLPLGDRAPSREIGVMTPARIHDEILDTLIRELQDVTAESQPAIVERNRRKRSAKQRETE